VYRFSYSAAKQVMRGLTALQLRTITYAVYKRVIQRHGKRHEQP
jgi:hypothetical protein